MGAGNSHTALKVSEAIERRKITTRGCGGRGAGRGGKSEGRGMDHTANTGRRTSGISDGCSSENISTASSRRRSRRIATKDYLQRTEEGLLVDKSGRSVTTTMSERKAVIDQKRVQRKLNAAAKSYEAEQAKLLYKKAYGSKQRRTSKGAAGEVTVQRGDGVRLSPVRKQLGGKGKRLQRSSPAEDSKFTAQQRKGQKYPLWLSIEQLHKIKLMNQSPRWRDHCSRKILR